MTAPTTARRRPVPREWRDEHHWLNMSSRRSYGVQKGSSFYSRSGGRCSCGATFGTAAGRHNYGYAEVLEQWKDHVEAEYYADQDGEQP